MGIRVDSTPNNTEHSYKAPTKVVIASTIGSAGGVGCYLHNLTKSSDGKNIWHKIRNLKIGIKEGLLLCAFSTLGGLLPSLFLDKKENMHAKLDEANHQLVGNGVIPFSCLALVNKCSEKAPKPIRSILAVGTLFSSTFLGHSIVDKISGAHNKYKVSIADFLPDIDDWVLALSTVLKSPVLYKLTAILCPITYSTLGIRTGCRQKDEKKLDKII